MKVVWLNYFFWLVQLELILSSATVVVALFSLVAGIFGMNIPYEWNEDHSEAFTWVRNKMNSVQFLFATSLLKLHFLHSLRFIESSLKDHEAQSGPHDFSIGFE